MIVQVMLFAAARQSVGDDVIEVRLQDSATVRDLRCRIVQQFPSLAPWEPHLLFAVDQQFATDDRPLTENAEIACFPPVSGG